MLKVITLLTVTLVLIIAPNASNAEPASLKERIAHTNPASFQLLKGPHQGAGEMKFQGLLNSPAFNTNFLFLHCGVILPKGGIGHHFHHKMEEMYVILEGEAEFTISGRTARLKGPVAVPCKLGQSHAIYNPTDKPIRWLNFAVSLRKGRGDSFDLNDDRVGVPIDRKPVFVSTPLTRGRLGTIEGLHGGKGKVHQRRALQPEVFTTNWAYVDHLVIPRGSSTGEHTTKGVEELYYVISGSGSVTVNGQNVSIIEGDAVPVLLNEAQSVTNTSEKDLELLVIGIASEKK